MSAPEYPREWFKVSLWMNEPVAVLFERETATRLYYKPYGRERFETKHTSYSQWFPTREEAQAEIDKRKANTAARNAANRIRNTAPELLDALEALFADYKQLADSGDAGNWSLEDTPEGQQALAAIAKARGAA